MADPNDPAFYEIIPVNADDPEKGPAFMPHNHVDPHWWHRTFGVDVAFPTYTPPVDPPPVTP